MVKKTFSAWLILAGVIFLPLACHANEPVNLALNKQQLIRYHDSGAYQQDINHVMQQALTYLTARVAAPDANKQKLAMILDIDETSLSNYRDLKKLDFGGTVDDIQRAEDQGTDAAILPTLALYHFAKAHHIAVFFITGRFEEERTITAHNLQQAGYQHWDGLILRFGPYRQVPAEVYKTAMRKTLTQKGYDIVLSAGDQQSDLIGGYAEKTFKLPNPYYFIP